MNLQAQDPFLPLSYAHALNGYELTARRAIDTKVLNICDNVLIIDGRGNGGHIILE